LDSVSQKLYLVDVRDGSILRTLDTPSSLPTGLAWDGRTLWLADANLDKICQMDPRDGSVIRNFDTSDSVPTGLAWFGTALWLIGAALDDVIEMDLRDGTVKRSADTPSTGAQCMTADRRTLWTDDSGTHLIYQLSLN
jgi:sugar lactone lactonase YvrE